MLCMFYSCSAMLGTFDILYLLLAGLWGMQFFFLTEWKRGSGSSGFLLQSSLPNQGHKEESACDCVTEIQDNTTTPCVCSIHI